jgi:hypothetical protein
MNKNLLADIYNYRISISDDYEVESKIKSIKIEYEKEE